MTVAAAVLAASLVLDAVLLAALVVAVRAARARGDEARRLRLQLTGTPRRHVAGVPRGGPVVPAQRSAARAQVGSRPRK